MRSSNGSYYEGLDHLRGLAAFLVVFWHFSYRPGQAPLPTAQAPWLGLLDQGHVGVALFMTLSGYLFAKLIGDRDINYRQFLCNRLLRLGPLLLLVLCGYGLLYYPSELPNYFAHLTYGLIVPNWPSGAWSVMVELQFYLLLPLILIGVRRSPSLPLLLVVGMIMLRLVLFALDKDIHHIAFFSLVGRADQFLIGIYIARNPLSRNGAKAALALLVLAYAAFAATGGYYGTGNAAFWIILPTIEAIGCAALISRYDGNPWRGRAMDAIGKSGRYSYGIYLLHGFLVTPVAVAVDKLVGLDTNLEALPFALLFFGYMTALGSISHRFIEKPFLRLRRPYQGRREENPAPSAIAQSV